MYWLSRAFHSKHSTTYDADWPVVCTSAVIKAAARRARIERREAQAGTRQARSVAVDADARNAQPTKRHRALREGSSSWVDSSRSVIKAL